METTTSRLPIPGDILDSCFLVLPESGENICFFDIETTGLSPKVSSLYLLGAARLERDSIYLTQWFAEDYTSERDILLAFAEFIRPFHVLVHYNGATFDIPYLEKKYAEHNLPSPFVTIQSLDIFREIKRFKPLFHTPDQKLTTMERLLAFRRRDSFSGKDCIRLYTEFMQKKYFRDPLAKERKDSLLLHNHDDLVGTILCSRLLSYSRYTPGSPSCRLHGNSLVLEDTMPWQYPVDSGMDRDGLRLSFQGNTLRLEIPLYRGTLYHFYENYKDYFYLPEEDMAVHKSVGIYVDKSHRQQAKASNCYTKKSGLFLPLPKGFTPEGQPLFRPSRKKALSYLYVPGEDFTLTQPQCIDYIRHVV